jgi:hypothetical protein
MNFPYLRIYVGYYRFVEVEQAFDVPDSAVSVFPTPGSPLSNMIKPRPVNTTTCISKTVITLDT